MTRAEITALGAEVNAACRAVANWLPAKNAPQAVIYSYTGSANGWAFVLAYMAEHAEATAARNGQIVRVDPAVAREVTAKIKESQRGKP